MEGRFLKYRWQKVGLIVLAITIVITLFLVFFLDSLIAPIASRKIKNGIIKGSDSLYHIQFDKLSLQVLKGDALLEGVTLMPDTAVFRRMKRQGRAPAMLYSGKVKQLEITGLHPLLYYFKKKLEIGKISILDPELTVKIDEKGDKPQPKKAPRTLYEKIAGSLKMIHVDLINLEHTHLIYQDLTGQKPASYQLKDLTLQATDLLIDSVTQKDSLRTLFCKNIEASITNFTGTSEDHLYRYRLKRAIFSTQNEILKITGVMVQPLAPQAFFAKSNGDRFSLQLDSIILTHLNYRTFMFDKYLEVKKLTFSKGSFSVYSNPHGKLQSTDRIVTFPNYVIRKITTIFNIDTLDIRKLNVDYSEFNNQSKKTGFISFKQTNARFLNITNQKIRLRQNAFCTVKLSTFFMGRGKLDLSFLFNLDDQDYNYSYQGHLGPLSTGSAVFIKYKEKFFICTAEHVANYKNCPVSIITGAVKNGQSLLYEFGTFSFLEKFTLKEATKEELLRQLENLGDGEFQDIAFRETLLLYNIIQPARKIQLEGLGELNIKEEGKSIILADNDFSIDENELYSFFGRTNTIIDRNKNILDFKERLYWGLTIHEISEEYIAFDLGAPIGSHDRFEGCSGAPIFDSKGRLVALLTHGDDDVTSSIIYGFRFDKTKEYINMMYFSGI